MFLASRVNETIKDAGGSMKAQIKPATNKYDEIMKNKVVKTTEKDGIVNAINSNPMYRTASEQLNDNFNRKRRNKDKNNNRRYETPDISDLRRIYADDEKKEFNPYMVAGGTVLSAGALQALIQKDISAPFRSAKEGAIHFGYRIPKQTFGNTKAGKEIFKVIKKGTRGVRNKRASEDINELFEKKASAFDDINIGDAVSAGKRVGSKGKAVKDMITRDFVRAGLETIPAYGTPAALGYVLSKRYSQPLRQESEKKRKPRYPQRTITIDIPAKDVGSVISDPMAVVEKRASNTESWSDWLTKTVPARALQGTARAIVPTAIALATGRNIRSNFEKTERQKEKEGNVNKPKFEPVEKGMVRMTIELPEGQRPSESLKHIYKTAVTAEGDAEKMLELLTEKEIDKVERRKNKGLSLFDKLTEGQQKQRRMKE